MRKIMMPISGHEAEELQGVLREAIGGFHSEIVRTEQWELKDVLKERVKILERLAARLQRSADREKAA